jgi:hypothetical protein
MEGKNFTLIGVNSDKLEDGRAAAKKNELNWRSFQNIQEGGKISTLWEVNAWPTILVIDQNLKIVYRGHDGHEASKIAKGLVGTPTVDG